MKCLLLEAKEYQIGFKAGLSFSGFEDGKIQWLGTKEEWNKFEHLQRLDDDGDDLLREKLEQEYQDEMRADLEEILN